MGQKFGLNTYIMQKYTFTWGKPEFISMVTE